MLRAADKLDDNDFADRVYEASVLPEFWPGVLRDFARIADSREAVLVAADEQSFRWVCSSPEAERLAQEVYKYPAGAERSRRLIALQRAGFATELDVMSEAEFLGEPMYADMLIPQGYGRGVATAIQVPGASTIIVHAEGDYRQGRPAPELFARLDALRPHLARSALLSARLAFERARTAVETLSALGLAACAVTDRGAVLVANGEFERETGFWTTRGRDRVALQDRRADRLLAGALASLHAGASVRSIPLRAAAESPSAVLHVVPIRRSAHDLFGHAAAIIVLTKPVDHPTSATPLLQALFDLTPTEADLAARIAAGQTAGEVAAADRKSIDTVRNQLKSVLSKTGCRRQPDLARVLAQLVPPRAPLPRKTAAA